MSRPYPIFVERLWALYRWPEWNLPMVGVTADTLLRYRSQPEYVSDDLRTEKQPTRAWDYGRIRFFFEQLGRGVTLDPIEIDNHCDGGRIYPEPVLNDGHHRFAAAHLFGCTTILATYCGRVDLLRYLTGQCKSCPQI